MDRYEELQRKAEEVMKRLIPDRQPGSHGALSAAEELAPAFNELQRTVVVGGVYGDPTVDLKTRALCTVAALTVLVRPPLLKTWVGLALNVGNTKEEISAIIAQMGFYGGIPSTAMAFTAAKEAFDQAGV